MVLSRNKGKIFSGSSACGQSAAGDSITRLWLFDMEIKSRVRGGVLGYSVPLYFGFIVIY